MKIHPTAVVHPSANLGEGVQVGPYAIIEEDVTVGNNSVIGSHAVIGRWTIIGNNCHLFPHTVVGMPPQDLKYKGENTTLVIGDNTVIREFATLNRGTVPGGGKTTVGENNFIMAYAHVAHDCHLGKNVIIANGCNLAGHVTIEDYAILGGLTAIHQFVTIGAYAIVGGASAVVKDVVPFAMAAGNRIEIEGINLIGLKRRGFSEEEILNLKRAFKLIFHSKLNTTQALQAISEQIKDSPSVNRLVEFINNSQRGISK